MNEPETSIAAMPFSNLSLREDIIQSFLQGDWEKVIKLQSGLNESYFLWPKPEKRDLDFIFQSLKRQNISSVVSIGCGTGLLEWLLTASTGLPVTGIEIDRNYWSSKYARACFTKLIFPDDEAFLKTIEGPHSAMMFCYFNDKDAFKEYLEIYKGGCLVIIGPHNAGRLDRVKNYSMPSFTHLVEFITIPAQKKLIKDEQAWTEYFLDSVQFGRSLLI